ncbi:hypothetical protein F2Q68_00004169 [Brassica cretica]|uniref:Uncharacterized protein n=1 Tax=Brassica cretica TaxID=69181 RepID=A0A8S9JNJ0_BRACR|nr:hypothetical protein F2Q68_00004169 [Brassica cretica]
MHNMIIEDERDINAPVRDTRPAPQATVEMDLTWIVVKLRNREDSGHGKMVLRGPSLGKERKRLAHPGRLWRMVDDVDNQQELRDEDGAKSSHAGARAGLDSGADEMIEPSMKDVLAADLTWIVVKLRNREDSGHGKMCGVWDQVSEKKGSGWRIQAGCGGWYQSGPRLPVQTGVVNNETGEPLEPIIPTEVQVDDVDNQQELRDEDGSKSSHAGARAGLDSGADEMIEPSMKDVLAAVQMMGTQDDSSHGKMCGVWGTKKTKARKGKEAAGASGHAVVDGTNPTQVLPTQTGLVNNETGEPVVPTIPTEVQVDDADNQQELRHEEEAESSHAGEHAGLKTGAEELTSRP